MPVDPLALAVSHGLCLLKARDKAGGGSGKGLRSRARDFPSLVASAGLAQALLFYLSKTSGKEAEYTVTYKIIKSSNGKDCNIPADISNKDLASIFSDSEGAGYGVLLALVAHAIETLTPGTGSCSFSTREGLAQYILYLSTVEGRKKELEHTAILKPYLESLKRVIEAFFGGGK